MKRNLIRLLVISSIISTLALTSCATTKTEYKAVYILPELYFPKFPAPDVAIPLDADKVEVTDNDTVIEYVIIPYSYYQSLVKYKATMKETEVKYTTFKEKLTNNR